MKPGFALSLSQEGIALLHRTAQGFVPLGQADPEAADLSERLAELGLAAREIAPEGFISKIIVPESQILYTEIDAPGPDRAARRAQITKALEGRTPYAVSDLVFDWSGTGRRVMVAVVARITLEEAEAFAEDHRFHPVAFVAAPPDGRFAGEPYFGMTSRALAHLPRGERVDRDQDPVRWAAAPAPPGAADAGPAAAAAEAPAFAGEEAEAPFVMVEDEGGTASAPVAGPGSGPSAEGDPAAGAMAGEPLSGAEAPDPDDAPRAERDDAGAKADAKAAPEAVAMAEQAAVPAPDADAEPDAEPADGAAAVAAPAADAGGADHRPAPVQPLAEAPEPEPQAQDGPADAPPAVEAAPEADPAEPLRGAIEDVAGSMSGAGVTLPVFDLAEDKVEAADRAAGRVAAPAADDAPAFFTRRQRRNRAAAQQPQNPRPPLRDDAGATPPVAPGLRVPDPAAPRLGPASAPLSVTAPLVPPPLVPVGAAERQSADWTGPAPDRPRPPPRPQLPGAKGKKRSVLSRVLARRGAAADAPKPLRKRAKAPGEEARELTRFGARSGVPGRPRYLGVALTAALVFVMAAVALWSALFGVGQPGTTPADTEVAAAETGTAPGGVGSDPSPGPVPSADSATSADATDPAQPDPMVQAAIATAMQDETGDVLPPPDGPDMGGDAAVDAPAAADAGVAATGAGPEAAPDAQTGVAAAGPAPDPDTAARTPAETPAALAAPTTLSASSSGAAVTAPAAGEAAPAAATGSLPVPDNLARLRDLGIWDAAPAFAEEPLPDANGGPADAAADPDPAFVANMPLPDADTLGLDHAPDPQPAPVPYAQATRYGADGLIEATPEGVLTPGGFTLIAGTPKVVPPVRPADLAPSAAMPAAMPAAIPAAPDPLAGKRPAARPPRPGDNAAVAAPEPAPVLAAAAPPPPADPAHAALKPRLRPPGIVATVAAAAAVAPVAIAPTPLPPPADPAHAALKPRARSPAALARAEQRDATADAVAAAAAAALAAEAASAAAPGVRSASKLAVASSRRPSAKPSQFAASVEAAVALAAAGPAAAVAAAPVPDPAPETAPAAEQTVAAAEIDEPEVESAAPDIPTRASVAKQATIRNALDMGDVSLIGVYGSSQNRRALVRMSTGRFVKVEVGDRLDGGRVQAIGDGQLTYQKNGRNIVLKMIRDS